jgi:nucleoside-diphosphate-sugar epimerase
LNILTAAREHGVKRVVYASSASVYGDIGNEIANECMKPNPASPYAASKVVNEVYAKIFSSNNTQVAHVDTVGLRYFNVYGPGQLPKGRHSSVIPQWIKELRTNGTVHIFGNGQSTRDFVFISDVVRANLLAALATKEDIPISGEVFNVASGESVTLLHLYGTILQAMGLQGKAFNPVIDAALRPGDVVQSHGSPAKIRNAMGWEPMVKLDVGISNVVASLE